MSKLSSQTLKVPRLRFPGFKGVWEEKRLGDFFEITSSKRVFESEWTTSGIPFYRAREIVKLSEDGYVDNELFISEDMFLRYKKKYGAPKANDILVTGVGTIGVIYVVENGDEFYFKDGNIVWLKSQNTIHSDFVKYIFGTRKVRKQVIGNAAISTVGTFTIDQAKKTKVTIPNIKEQQKIADFLGSVDSWIENLRMQKSTFESYKKSIMQKIFSQEIRFKDDNGKNFPKWEEKRLGEVLKIGNGRDFKHLESGNIPVFGTGGLMCLVNKSLYSGETVFIGRKGTINKPFYYNGSFWTVDTLFYTFDFKEITPKFTDFIFQRINWLKYNEASGVPSLSKATIEKIKVNIPIIQEQQKIANFLTSLDKVIESKQQQITRAEQWKKGLMQGLFV